MIGLLLGPPDASTLPDAAGPADELAGGSAGGSAVDGSGLPAGVDASGVERVVQVDPSSARLSDFETAERGALTALASAGLIKPFGLVEWDISCADRVYTPTERERLAG